MSTHPLRINDADPQDREALCGDGLLTVREAAEFLSISRSKLYEMMDNGELNFVKLGRCVRYRRSDLDQYLDRQTRVGALHSRQSRRAR